jgi:deoxyribonuclease V
VNIIKLSANTSSIITHPWNLNQQEAANLQRQLCRQVIQSPGIRMADVTTVAGIDTHYHNGLATAAVVTMRLTDLSTVEYATAARRVTFPYIPGLLSFREGPVVLDAIKKLTSSPDVLIFDGQGIAHPRRFGLACHMGLVVDIPAIGCAKTWLSGRYTEPAETKGSYSYLRDGNETIGAAVRTRERVKPLFVSVGHRMNLQDSIRIVLKCCRRYRLPEPIRQAHALARRLVK